MSERNWKKVSFIECIEPHHKRHPKSYTSQSQLHREVLHVSPHPPAPKSFNETFQLASSPGSSQFSRKSRDEATLQPVLTHTCVNLLEVSCSLKSSQFPLTVHSAHVHTLLAHVVVRDLSLPMKKIQSAGNAPPTHYQSFHTHSLKNSHNWYDWFGNDH